MSEFDPQKLRAKQINSFVTSFIESQCHLPNSPEKQKQSQTNKYESKQLMFTQSCYNFDKILQQIEFEVSKQMNQNNQFNNPIKLRTQYYDFFKDIIPDPQNYVPEMPSDQQFKKHKIKYLKGNQFYQQLQSYHQPYIRIKNIEREGTIVNYIVIISMFELEITLLNIDQDAKIQMNKIGTGCFGSVRIQSQNKRMFAVKRQKFKDKYHIKEFNIMANKYEIEQVIKQLAIYKICSLLKIGPAVETDIGFDLICYRDCIQFQIQYCIKIEYGSRNDYREGIFVDQNKFEKQIKQCLLTLHFYRIIHKDIKPANILFSIKYNKYVLTDFGISHSVVEQIGHRSQTHCQGTLLFMSRQMLSVTKGKTGYVHLYGNDVHSLQLSLRKQIYHQNIEISLKQFNQKFISECNSTYEYEYLKLKYYCIKSNSKMEEVQNYWRYMNYSRREQLIEIIQKSIEYDKIKSVYNYLSISQEFKKWNLESLRIQSQSIKNIKIDPNIKQNTQLYLKNALRVYGYSQQIKDMITKLKLQQKFKETLKIIDKIIDKNSEANYRDSMFGNHKNYIKKIKNQLDICQQIKDYEGIFNKYMVILKYGNTQERIKTIQKLNMLQYERKKEEKIEEIIRVTNIEKNKDKIKLFVQMMEMQNKEKDKIITEKQLEDNVSEVYDYVGDYKKALKYYTKSINMKISFYGQQHPSVADTYNNIANVYQKMGKYEKSLQYYTKSVNMQISFHGQQHPSVADTYNNIANVYQKMGMYQKALQYYSKSVNTKISFYGQQHPAVADTYNNIACTYDTIGKYQKALQYYTKSINMKISFYGQQHPSVAYTYNNIGLVYNQMGKYQKALQYYSKSVNTQIQFYGQQHPAVADTYNNIACTYDTIGKYQKALQYYTKSINMKISFYGQQHPSVAYTYNNIGLVYKKMGKHKKSLQYYTKSINMQISFHGQQHPTVADTYNNIANVYKQMGKYEKALQYYTKSVNMHIQFYGQKHQCIADTYNNISLIYDGMGKYEKSLQYYTKSINMKISLNGQQHPSVADAYNNIANVYQKMGKYEKSLQYYTKSVNMQISFHGQQHPSVADTYNNIANVYQKMGMYQKALQYYSKSVNMQISFHGQQHPSISVTFYNISTIFFSLNLLNQSLKYCNKSIKIQSNLSLMQYPQTGSSYHLLSCIFHKKEKYIKSLHYEYSALDTFLKFSHFDNHNSPYYLSKLADIYYEINRFIQSYFFYRMSCQISVKYFPIHDTNVRKAKHMMNKMQWSMPSLINNYTSNIQFMNDISNKYSKLPYHKLIKLLLAKKWQLRFQQQHRDRRDRFQYLKCVIEIYLCYKCLGQLRQTNKAEDQMKLELLRIQQSQQKSIFREFIQEISLKR